MTDQELEDCFAMFRGVTGASPKECYAFAREMMDVRKHKENDDEEDSGIVAVVPKRSRKR